MLITVTNEFFLKQDIRKLTEAELITYFESHRYKAFQARQTYEWLWKKSVKNFDDMTNISMAIRDFLRQHFTINHIQLHSIRRSSDGTIKNAVRLHDGLMVESVLIPSEKRITACVSSQVGCSLACQFCATGKMKRIRNLNPDEIYDQVVAVKEQSLLYFDRPLTNIVFMGMGEPLLNYTNLMVTIEKITSPQGLNMASKRITVSTVGIAKMIMKIADDGAKFNLAVSLHSAIDSIRSSIMNINDTNSLDDLKKALKYYYNKRRKKVTFEYVIWKGINDTKNDAMALLNFCKIIPCKVNLIEYNPIEGEAFQSASEDKINMYIDLLESHGITVRIRKSRGNDIEAACGQLANKFI